MLSKATLIGRVGKKQTKPMQSGGDRTFLSIATSKKYMDKATGQKKQTTSWHNVSCYSGLSGIAEKYINVGDLVYVEGEISSRSVKAPDGKNYTSYNITAKELTMLPNPKKAEQGGNNYNGQHQNQQPDYDAVPF